MAGCAILLGDISNSKLITMAWKNVCVALDKGNLGLLSFRRINEAASLKLCWEFVHGTADWVSMIQDRCLWQNQPTRTFRKSSLWTAIKKFFPTIIAYTGWVVGNGYSINFWTDTWLVRRSSFTRIGEC